MQHGQQLDDKTLVSCDKYPTALDPTDAGWCIEKNTPSKHDDPTDAQLRLNLGKYGHQSSTKKYRSCSFNQCGTFLTM